MSAVLSNVSKFPPIVETLDDLVHQYVNAKQAEEGARKIRVQLEERIIAMHPAKEEGSETVTLDNGFKLTLTGKLIYSCDDPRGLAAACVGAGWAESMVPVKTELKLDETGAKWLRHNEPEAWRLVAQYVEIKPAKTAVKVGL